MIWVVLIGDNNLNIDYIKNVKHYESKACYTLPLNRCSIEYKDEYISYDFIENLLNYYNKNDMAKIPFKNPNFILMSGSSKEILSKVLKQNNFPKNIYVDDDSGNIIPLNEFIA